MQIHAKFRKKFREEAACLRSQLVLKRDKLRDRILANYLQHYVGVTGDKIPLGHLRNRRYDLLYRHVTQLDAVHPDRDATFAVSQLKALVKKYPWQPASVKLDPETAALAAFEGAEHRCKRTNQWFRAARRVRPSALHIFEGARRWIEYVIGVEPDVDSCLKLSGFSAGASIGCSGSATHLGRKAGATRITGSAGVVPLFIRAAKHNFHLLDIWEWERTLAVLRGEPARAGVTYERTDYNKIAFVPKTAKTHRSIAVEPLANGFVQKGIDLYLRKCLCRVGIDLTDQALNQKLALQGSRDDGNRSFVTIDLQAASDSLATELVRHLLPPAWFDFLNCARSPAYKLPSGASQRYEKFVSMGNGFCFPLESLIFASFCAATGRAREDWSVYGDDIIVRKDVSETVLQLLARGGFKLNRDKTFLQGPFRESCGADWYAGEDVSPFTWDFELLEVRDLYKFVNLARRSLRTTEALAGAINIVLAELEQLPTLLLWRPFFGPPDTGLDPLDTYETVFARSKRWQCPQWIELLTTPVVDRRDYPPWVVLYAALTGASSSAPFTFRRKTKTRLRVCAGWGSSESRQPRSLEGQRILRVLGVTA